MDIKTGQFFSLEMKTQCLKFGMEDNWANMCRKTCNEGAYTAG